MFVYIVKAPDKITTTIYAVFNSIERSLNIENMHCVMEGLGLGGA